jgi:hypothetical protein
MIEDNLMENKVKKMYNTIYAKVDAKRKESLFLGNYGFWAVSSNYLGIDPELPELYNQTMNELLIDKPKLNELEKEIEKYFTPLNYNQKKNEKKKDNNKKDAGELFYQSYKTQKINAYDIIVDTPKKIRTLKNHFERFLEGKSQDLNKYNDFQIGVIFKKLVEGYEKKYNK